MNEGGVTGCKMTKVVFPVTVLYALLHTVLCQPIDIERQQVGLKIYEALSTSNPDVLKPYNAELFKPLDGPFFRPLWELFPPYNAFAVLGFPPLNASGSETTVPMIRENQTLTLYDENADAVFTYKMVENVTVFEIILQVLNLMELDMYSHVISQHDCGVMNLSSSIDRVRYQEVVRPRYYLPTVIDIHRLLLKSAEVCSAGAYSADCFLGLQDYSQVLWMYNWVICSIIGSDEAYDVDGICPKLCRPHTMEVMSGSHDTSLSVPLIYHKIASEDAIDVCEQLNHAVAGSCELLNGNRSVHMDEFKCQCISPAYEWTQTEHYRGCLLRREILESDTEANDTNLHVKCPMEESDCDEEGTEFCYHRLQRNSTTSEIVPSESGTLVIVALRY
ncbi:unnamed protein product [Dicrocoelium dendriticum]|nr:unnamed protein product [Dicrocoelium dendriticum]